MDRKPVFAIDASGGSGFGEDETALHSNKDCGPGVVGATEQLVAARKMILLSREIQADRALVHFRAPNDQRRYLEVLYRHQPKKFAAHLSFDLLFPSGASVDPSAVLSHDDVEAFRQKLREAVNCE